MGITYFDTARVYQNGNNERMVGAALKNRRKNIVLSSKTGAHNRADALANLDTSLKELGTDYLDIWYLHGKTHPEDVTDELIDAQQAPNRRARSASPASARTAVSPSSSPSSPRIPRST